MSSCVDFASENGGSTELGSLLFWRAVGTRRLAVCSRCNENRSPINNDYVYKKISCYSLFWFATTTTPLKIVDTGYRWLLIWTVQQVWIVTRPAIIHPKCTVSGNKQNRNVLVHKTIQTCAKLHYWSPWLVSPLWQNPVQVVLCILTHHHHFIYFLPCYHYPEGAPVTNNTGETWYSEQASTPRQLSLPLISVGLQICS